MKMEKMHAQAGLEIAIEEYAKRRSGKRPAKIFVSEEMFEDMVKEARALIAFQYENPPDKFYGIPIVRYGNTGKAEYYLSDEEEETK